MWQPDFFIILNKFVPCSLKSKKNKYSISGFGK